VEAQSTEPGWYPDPTGRHEYRFWSGTEWSRHVDDAGMRSFDVLESLVEGPTYVVPAARGPRSREDKVVRGRRRRRRRRRFALVAVVLAAALGLAGGATAGLILTLDDGDDATVAPPVDPLTSSLEEYILDTSVGEVTEADATCMAQRVIDTVGREALESAGVDRGADPLIALSDDQVQAGLGNAFGCLDDPTLTAVMIRTFSPSMQANLGVADSGCLIEGWMAGLGRETMIDIYSQWAASRNADILGALPDDQVGVMAGVVADCQASHPVSTTAPPPAP
jgi:Protein of unknown function (DUF2510)